MVTPGYDEQRRPPRTRTNAAAAGSRERGLLGDLRFDDRGDLGRLVGVGRDGDLVLFDQRIDHRFVFILEVVGRVEFGFSRFLRSLVGRSEEHTSELQSLMRISYAVFCLKK